jgi:uncharacterized phage protein gp47/JayE
VEDAQSVRARFDADANAGRDPADPAYVDTTEGGFYWDLTQVSVLECVRLWDFLGTEMVAAMFPGTAWGDYLDMHGETLNLPRNDEVPATGAVMFSGAIGTLIAAGTEVGTLQPDPSAAAEPTTFTTDRTIALFATPGPTNLTATPSGSGGVIPAGTYYYRVTAIGPNGETIASNEVTVTLTGTTSSVALNWDDYPGATDYRVYRSSTPDNEALMHVLGSSTSAYTDTGAAVPSTDLVPTNTAPITAEVAGAAGNVPSGTITQVLSPTEGITAVTNPQPTSGGADVESDRRYRLRIDAEYGQAGGAGNIFDYVRWGLMIPQIGNVTVQPLWAGAGTVRLIVTDEHNQPVSASVVLAAQQLIDPIPQQGAGLAPIGALVTTTTPSLLAVVVTAVLAFESGYSLDGTGGTIALRQTIIDSINSYVGSRPPGEDVMRSKVIGQISLVPGVSDVTGVLLNGVAGNVTVAALEVASPGTHVLS